MLVLDLYNSVGTVIIGIWVELVSRKLMYEGCLLNYLCTVGTRNWMHFEDFQLYWMQWLNSAENVDGLNGRKCRIICRNVNDIGM